MTPNLDAALRFLQLVPEAKLFPAHWGRSEKRGVITHCPEVKWGKNSSSDPAQIKAWAKKWPKAYFCINMKASGLRALDPDRGKGDGRDGFRVLQDLELDHGDLPPTLRARTPNGGGHILFKGDCRQGAHRLGHGLDLAVMIPVPGSHAEGKGNYVIESWLPPAPLPEWIIQMAGKKREKAAEASEDTALDLDLPHHVLDAVEAIKAAPEAIEGYGGDSVALQVAMRVRDLGISEHTALDLMHRFYADKCSPYDADWLSEKVRNAYKYASGKIGGMTAEEAFKDVVVEPEPQLAYRLCDLKVKGTPKREWILGYRYIRKFMTVTIAPGGGSKSTLTMTEMLSIATGKPLTGENVHSTGPVWVINTEDPRDEIQRRMAAICQHFSLDPDAIDNFHLTGKEAKLVLATQGKNGVVVNRNTVKQIEDYIRENNISVWSIDPLVRAHRVNENDNAAIDVVADIISGICDRTNSSASIVHHTRKGADIAGNMDAMRGASALAAAARIADTLTVMSEAEAKRLGVDKAQRRHYVRLDDAKANMRAPSESTAWFERKSVSLASGDSVGILEPVKLQEVEVEGMDPFHKTLADIMVKELPPGNNISVNQAAEMIIEKYGNLIKNEKGVPARRTVATNLIKLYETPLEIGRVQIRYVHSTSKGQNGNHFLYSREVAADEICPPSK